MVQEPLASFALPSTLAELNGMWSSRTAQHTTEQPVQHIAVPKEHMCFKELYYEIFTNLSLIQFNLNYS